MATIKRIKTIFQIRRDITANWELNKDVVPAAGEPCYDIELKTLRIGDGYTTYENLPVIGNSESGDISGLQAEVNAIKTLIESLQTDIDNVETDIAGVQEQVGEADVAEMQEDVTNLATQIESTAETVIELQTIVDNKIDVEAVETLKTDLQTYVDEQIKNVEIGNMDYGEI